MSENNREELWKKKLIALLHDPPHKPRAIKDHEDQRSSFLNRLGLDEKDFDDFEHTPDCQAASADRLIFPEPTGSKLKVDWEENEFEFRHPLGGGIYKPEKYPSTAAVMEEKFTSALDGIETETKDYKSKFLRVWRLWYERSAREKYPHLAYIVADTRIPDHTLWHHNSIASAFVSAGSSPSFLLFQIGPVQEFIAQARKTIDLWSGSYLLSYLISRALVAILEEIGPDTIIYPQLKGVPLIDLHFFEQDYINNKLRASHPNELLTPNLPNRFLALVPGGKEGERLAKKAEKEVRETWKKIADSVHKQIQEKVGKDFEDWDVAWENQVRRFPAIDWVIHSWTAVKESIKFAEKGIPPIDGGWNNDPLYHAYLWATEMIPEDQREEYTPESYRAFAWSLHYRTTDWKFAGRKNARYFSQWVEVGSGLRKAVPKDYLDGKNEVIGGKDHEQFWEKLRKTFETDFRGSQVYGAITVIKRLWPECYLKNELKWDPYKPSFDSVKEIANAIDNAEENKGRDSEKNTYYAILIMDGDNMGEWVSGSRTPRLKDVLAEQAYKYFEKHWRTRDSLSNADSVKRPLSPGYHAALSEALSNFSLYCAGPIVERFNGQIIYSGGDDVLAMLPAENALDCAYALQIAFRGLDPEDPKLNASEKVKEILKSLFDYSHHVDGFIKLNRNSNGVGRAEHLKPNWHLMVMGPKASISAGIAISHVHSPMQDAIQAAREAESEAKSLPEKGGFCLKILKRSGESVSFSAKWDSGAPGLWSELNYGFYNLSSRFAYRYAQLVQNLVVEGISDGGRKYVEDWQAPSHSELDLITAIEAELAHTLSRQGNMSKQEANKLAKNWCDRILRKDGNSNMKPKDYLNFWLCWAFIKRITKSDKSE